MATPYKLPEIAESIVEGEIGKWIKNEGEFVKKEEPFVEILTDKVNVELPSPNEGYLIKILKNEGEIVQVGEIIAYFGEKGEKIEEIKKEIGEIKKEGKEVKIEEKVSIEEGRVLAPPGVRKRAREMGIDLSQVKGTGPGGRIRMEDLFEFKKEKKVEKPAITKEKSPEQVEVPPVETEKIPPSLEKVKRIPFKGIRRQISERLVQSKQNLVHTLHTDEADVTELVELVKKLKNSKIVREKNIRLTYLPFIIQAVIIALKKFPTMNSSLDPENGEIILKNYYNIGIAVATENGLLVPNIKDADKKGLFTIAKEIEILADKARKGELSLREVQNGTFTLTNIGGIGGLFTFPVINYPESAILGLSRVKKRPWVVEGRIEVRDIIFLSLAFDHRITDGATAAMFVREIIEHLESPTLLYFKSD